MAQPHKYKIVSELDTLEGEGHMEGFFLEWETGNMKVFKYYVSECTWYRHSGREELKVQIHMKNKGQDPDKNFHYSQKNVHLSRSTLFH